MATAKIEVPHVHKAMYEILKSLSVEKDAKLPSNMSGKSYASAHSVSAEVKSKFVEHDLILYSNERMAHVEYMQNNGRTQISVVIEGTYLVVSTVDGSSQSISGVGDGLALGTAVASTMASTNAVKSALMRTFLITEQSVEDAAKNGVGDAGQGQPARVTQAESKISKARQPRETPAQAAPQESDAPNYRALIKGLIDAGDVTPDKVNARWAEIATELDKPKGDASVMEKLYKEIK